MKLSIECKKYFLDLAKDAGNWSGTPCLGANVAQGFKENGYLSDLKKKGLVSTFIDDGEEWVSFSESGKQLALKNGIEIN